MNPCLAFYQMGMWEMMILLVVVLLLFERSAFPKSQNPLDRAFANFKNP